MSKNSKGTKWDGKSRGSTDLYRNRWDEIFKKKTKKEKLNETKKFIKEIDSNPKSWAEGYWEWKKKNEEIG